MRAIARLFFISGFAALLALAGSGLLAAAAEAQPSGTPPTITPTADLTSTSPQVGDTLTEVAAQWSPTPMTDTIQWYHCDSLGNNCVSIGTTGMPGSTYTLTSGDKGFTIEVQETAMDGTGTTTLSSGPTLPVGPPVNTLPPGITGTAQEGQTLTEIPGTWPGAQPPVAIQWLRCDSTAANCANIHNATGQSYVLTSADVGNTVAVEETASNAGGAGTPADSAPSSPIATATTPVPVIQSLPTVSGTAQVGQTLSEANGSWSPTPTRFNYQWLDCDSSGNNCSPVAANGSGQIYVVASADVGSTIRVAETALNGTSAGIPADSAPSAVVVPATTAVPVNHALPTISGTTQLGQTLIEGHGSWSPAPTSYGYQWLRCDSSGHSCAAILSATGQSYTLTSADVSNTIEVEETAAVGGSAAAADSAPTATVTAPGVKVHSSSTTALLALPASPVTNQTVSLIATVTSSSPATPPVGKVAFEDAGTPISSCASVPVATFSQSANVTCPTAFSASTSPEHLTAVFTPAVGLSLTGSTSQTVAVVVGQASTSTTLDVNPTLFAGSKATYTATVAAGQAGPFQPSGSVQFSDHGKPIASCSSQPLNQSQSSLSAKCTIRYRKSGRHTITAQYSGDGGFSGSKSPSQAIRVEHQPIQTAGAITAKTNWTDYFTPTYTRFLAMLVHKLRLGTTIVFICRGHGCPFTRQSLLVTGSACASRASCVTEQGQVVDLFPRLRGYRLRVGTVLTIELTRRNWIGKAYVIKIRSGRKPTDQIKCLAPGSTRPGVGC